jgi:DNA segregation ATPase FtsK/SpoIIIE-like protein
MYSSIRRDCQCWLLTSLDHAQQDNSYHLVRHSSNFIFDPRRLSAGGRSFIELQEGDDMPHEATNDPLFDAAKQLVIESRTPSISLLQRRLRIAYSRAVSLLKAMEGEIVTGVNENGKRKMLSGESREY